jgi:hypothetical protein
MKRLKLYCGTIALAAILSCGFACPKGTQNLATASDAVAHALLNVQVAAQQAVTSGVMTQSEFAAFDTQLANVSQAGLVLDNAIRANESATSVAAKVNAFLIAFNTLQNSGVVGIKNVNTRQTISIIITGAESSIAIIAAAVGTTGAPAPVTFTKSAAKSGGN